MKVLLVEDSDSKAQQVEAVLHGAVPGRATVQRAKSFHSAIKRLETEVYDLLVLDLAIPIRDGETPNEKGGKKVLAEVLDGSTCRPPSHIICLTAFDDVAKSLSDDAQANLLHVVMYDETGDKWRGPLASKARFVEARIRDSENRPRDYKIDLAILTSSPHVELQQVLKLPGKFDCEYNQRDRIHYYTTNWQLPNARQLSVLACAAPSMGMTAACATACKIIETWRPRFLVMSGIAAGTKKDQKFGDILVAEAAYDYGSGKIAEADDGEFIFTPSYKQIPIDAGLHAVLQQWERDQLRTDHIRQAWHAPNPRVPRLILGLIASGAAVVQNKQLVEDILNKSRKVVGLEMEAYGVFHAAYLATAPQPRVIVAKSVSDFADKRKNDKWQQYAAFTSARFIYEFFTNAAELQLGS